MTEIYDQGRMASSGMLRRVALVRTDVSEELSSSIIRATRIAEPEATLALTSNRSARLEDISRTSGSIT
jgi:hypothetical protein